jgi:hypothetical protein
MKTDVTFNGATYSYPDGPFMPDYYVTYYKDGSVSYGFGTLDLAQAVSAGWGMPDTTRIRHLGPHHVTTWDDAGNVIENRDVPVHYWHGRWATYSPSSLTIKRTIDQVVQQRLSFAFGDTGNVPLACADYKYTDLWSSAGVTKYMPTTGERPDIGWMTDPDGLAMLGGPAGPMLAWAMANLSFPIFWRDETVKLPVSIVDYPAINAYDLPGYQGKPYIVKGPIDVSSGYPTAGGGFVAQQAHYCDMSYLAAVMTKNPIFLESCQYNAQFGLISDASKSIVQGTPTVSGERRGVAWALILLFKAYRVTKLAEDEGWFDPAVHRPSSYFKTLIDDSLLFYVTLDGTPEATQFGLNPPDRHYSPWMQDYLITALSFAALIGLTEWVPMYLVNLKNLIDRNSGLSGWPVAYGTPYRHDIEDADGNLVSWAESFDLQVTNPEVNLDQTTHDKLKADPTNGGAFLGGWEYYWTSTAGLVMANYLDKNGLAPVRQTYPMFDQALANSRRQFAQTQNTNPRVSVVDDPSKKLLVPVVVQPWSEDGTPVPVDPGDGGTTNPTPPPPPTNAPTRTTDNAPGPFADLKITEPGTSVIYTNRSYETIQWDPSLTKVVVVCRSATPTQVFDSWADRTYGWWVAMPDTADGGKVWQDQHATGQTVVLYGCAPGIAGWKWGTPEITAPGSYGDTTTIQDPTKGDVSMTAIPTFNGTLTATAKFYDDTETERAVDSVTWSGTGVTIAPQADKTAKITFLGGDYVINAVGHVGGNDISATPLSGTVALPFPTHGTIVLS